MGADFQQVFPGVRLWSAKENGNDVVYHFAVWPLPSARNGALMTQWPFQELTAYCFRAGTG